MARSTNYTYDPKTGKWTKTVSDEKETDKKTDDTKKTDEGKKSDGNSNLTSSNPNKNSSTGKVEKEYNEIQINTLSGTLNFIVTEETIKLRAGDTVKLNGLGKYLSGNYYVKEIARNISNSGYSHSATVMRTDFGDSLKTKATTTSPKKKGDSSTTPTTNKEPTSNKKPVSSPPTSDNAQRTHTVKKGECLWNIAIKYYGKGSDYKKIYDANTKKIANPNLIYVGQVFVIP